MTLNKIIEVKQTHIPLSKKKLKNRNCGFFENANHRHNTIVYKFFKTIDDLQSTINSQIAPLYHRR